MIDYTDKLLRLLASLPPLPGEEVGMAEGGRLPEAGMITGKVEEGAAHSPREWLDRYSIPIVERPANHADLFHGKAKATFIYMPLGGDKGKAQVCIPYGAYIDQSDYGWYIWHEIGHAMDYMMVREGEIIGTPHGHYSTEHLGLLRKHQELIITWTPISDRDYKTQAKELWAEVVACCVQAPLMCPPDLLEAVLPAMRKRGIPVQFDGNLNQGEQHAGE